MGRPDLIATAKVLHCRVSFWCLMTCHMYAAGQTLHAIVRPAQPVSPFLYDQPRQMLREVHNLLHLCCVLALQWTCVVHATRYEKGGEALGFADALANDADDADSASELAAIFAPHQASYLSRFNSTQVQGQQLIFLAGPFTC